MGKTRQITLAVLFGAFTAIVAMAVQLMATVLMDESVSRDTVIAMAVGGACIFVVSVLTALFVWPRIGFEPFDTHFREPT